jgi:hypothetical protein
MMTLGLPNHRSPLPSYAHSGSRGAGRAKRNTGGNAFICESAVLVVVIKLVRFSVDLRTNKSSQPSLS